MVAPAKEDSSAFRLRLGVILFFVWWLPIWLITPLISDALGSGAPKHLAFIVVALQSVIGLAGFIIAGKQILVIYRQNNFKKMPKTVWHVLWHGTMAPSSNAPKPLS